MNKILLQLLKRYGPKALKLLSTKNKNYNKLLVESTKKLSKPLSSNFWRTPEFKKRLAKEGISVPKYLKMSPFDKMVIQNKIKDKHHWIDAAKTKLKKDPTFYQRDANTSRIEHQAKLKEFLRMVRDKKLNWQIGQT